MNPFVPVDCSAIPPHLFESEFFGHERGAFTGANQRALGLMEYADGGTLFLDEIGELSLPQQAKLLRALQERSFRRVGSREETPVDIRLLAATNRDLKEEVANKRFRDDLYFRINVGEIRLPPLRERTGDIQLLLDYAWPGNVRELINVVRRMLAMSRRNLLSIEDVPEDLRKSVGVRERKTLRVEPADGTFLGQKTRAPRQIEHDYIVEVLQSCGGDISAAARIAQMSRQSVYRMLDRLHINPKDFRDADRA